MTNEERELIERFIARVGGSPQASAFGSVPATTQQSSNLPPLDPEADRTIRDNFQRYPEAPYRITQMAVVQEAALAESQNRIKRLEWELQQAQTQLQTVQQQPQQRSGGFFGGLFGGGQQNQNQAPPPRWGAQPGPQGYQGQQGYEGQQPGQGYPGGPPQPSYPPGYQPGMFQRQGSGFLGSALTTAAGVAGGMVAGNVLMDMFTGHGLGGGMGGGGGGGMGGETIVNNYGDAAGVPGGDAFGNAGGEVDPNFDTGGGDADFGGGGGDGGSWGGDDGF